MLEVGSGRCYYVIVLSYFDEKYRKYCIWVILVKSIGNIVYEVII